MRRRVIPVADIIIGIVNFILAIILLFVGLRILLKLFGASTNADFVAWWYDTSDSLVNPFLGMFPSPVLDNKYIIEFSSIFAFVVYVIAAYLIIQLIEYIEYTVSRRA